MQRTMSGSFSGWASSPQTVITLFRKAPTKDILRDSDLIPTYFSVVSLVALTLTAFLRKNKTEEHTENLREHIKSHGGILRFGLQILRFSLSVALVCLAAINGTRNIASSAVFGYILLLSLTVVVSSPKYDRLATRHVNLMLVVTLLVYTWRDLFPLATYTLEPEDIEEGVFLWWKIALIVVASSLPLYMPRPYKPVDPNKPSKNPNLEQTTSILGLISYSFLNPILSAASRVTHIPADQLPPLADYDDAEHLRDRIRGHVSSFNPPDLTASGRRQRHIFWSVLSLVRHEYLGMVVLAIIHSVAKFIVPVALNRLLRYLENDDDQLQLMRPWFWVLMMFVGPNIASMAIERYMYLALRALSHIDSILCQVIFSQSLRIRMKAEVDSGSDKKGLSLIGRINNLVTTDVNNILAGPHLPFFFTYIPVQLSASLLFLYTILGWSAFVAFGSTLLLFPIPGYLARIQHRLQEEKMKMTDERVQTVTETTKVVRMVKLFGWEAKMSERITEKREEELNLIRRLRYLDVITQVVNFLIPIITMISCYFTYVRLSFSSISFSEFLMAHTVIMKQQLKASVVFGSITVFDNLRIQCEFIVNILGKFIVAKVSFDRIDEFLVESELLDSFTPANYHLNPSGASSSSTNHTGLDFASARDDIVIHEALFTWTAESSKDPAKSSPERRFVLAVDQEILRFKKGKLNLIVGPTGSGKTSLLMALLGEMHYIPVAKDSYVNLPRAEGVAYAAQESWVQNETIRDNILFGSPFDESRYNKVIYQCGLERDLTLFEAGDRTEVGEKGITLSGGQKARITLARAVYSKADIVLLDDVLAALDVHTAKWIVDKCFRGDLLKGRTVLLVTHNIPLTAAIAEFVVSVKDGKISSQGSLDAALKKDQTLAKEAQDKMEELKEDEKKNEEKTSESENPSPSSKGKLILEEEIQLGRVGSSAAKLYGSAFGGKRPIFTFGVYIGGLFAAAAINVVQTWYLGYWAKQYELMDPAKVPVFQHLGVYGLLLIAAVVVSALTYMMFAFATVRASRTIHKKLIQSVLTATLRWLDITPVSRILARCTADINGVDMEIPGNFQGVAVLATRMSLQIFALILYTPVFVIPAFVLGGLGKWCGDLYARAVICVRRHQSNSKAPVLAQFEGAVAGIVSIRAYGVEESFEEELRRRVDENIRMTRTFFNIARWMPTRIEFFGSIFCSTLAGYLVYFGQGDPSTTGFSLTMGVTFTGAFLFLIFSYNSLEVVANSLERIDGYLNIEKEPGASSTGEPPAYWPASGDLRVENLSGRYSLDGPKVLHDLSFHVKAGERVGVVGRTGSGKACCKFSIFRIQNCTYLCWQSSLTLALLRCIYTDGKVFYGGVDTGGLNLDALRSRITIIPQMPELLSGSLRQNLDPFGEHDDATLNDVLRASGLLDLQKSKAQDEGEASDKLTLDTGIASGGTNLSVGQRQILALARAILRKSKLLILDEATSAIDYETDAIVQQSLRNELSSDTTVITIAHRLQTIMDSDRIMVLDAGRIVEFDTPKELLKREGGVLRALVDESADKGVLVDMARKRK